jgi:prophage regulatory protein
MRFIKVDEVKSRVGVSRAFIYKLIAGDRFPKPIKLGSASLWDEGEVLEWMDAKKAERLE